MTSSAQTPSQDTSACHQRGPRVPSPCLQDPRVWTYILGQAWCAALDRGLRKIPLIPPDFQQGLLEEMPLAYAVLAFLHTQTGRWTTEQYASVHAPRPQPPIQTPILTPDDFRDVIYVIQACLCSCGFNTLQQLIYALRQMWMSTDSRVTCQGFCLAPLRQIFITLNERQNGGMERNHTGCSDSVFPCSTCLVVCILLEIQTRHVAWHPAVLFAQQIPSTLSHQSSPPKLIQ
jgi:hypothetical protein